MNQAELEELFLFFVHIAVSLLIGISLGSLLGWGVVAEWNLRVTKNNQGCLLPGWATHAFQVFFATSGAFMIWTELTRSRRKRS